MDSANSNLTALQNAQNVERICKDQMQFIQMIGVQFEVCDKDIAS